MNTKLYTREEARAWFDYHGMSIAEFCRIHDLNKNMVSDLLKGRKKGDRGETHRAAVLLGIKAGSPKLVKPYLPSPALELQDDDASARAASPGSS